MEVFSQREPSHLFVTLIELQTPALSIGLLNFRGQPPEKWCDLVHLDSGVFACVRHTMTPPMLAPCNQGLGQTCPCHADEKRSCGIVFAYCGDILDFVLLEMDLCQSITYYVKHERRYHGDNCVLSNEEDAAVL